MAGTDVEKGAGTGSSWDERFARWDAAIDGRAADWVGSLDETAAQLDRQAAGHAGTLRGSFETIRAAGARLTSHLVRGAFNMDPPGPTEEPKP